MKKLILLLFIYLGGASGSAAKDLACGPADFESNRVDIYNLDNKFYYSLGDRPSSGGHAGANPQDIYVGANDPNPCYDIIEDNGGRLVMDLDHLDENSPYHYNTDPLKGAPAVDEPNPASAVFGAHEPTSGDGAAIANAENTRLGSFEANDIITDNNIPSIGTGNTGLGSLDINSGIMDNDVPLLGSDNLVFGDLNTLVKSVPAINAGDPSITQIIPADDVKDCCGITRLLGLDDGCCSGQCCDALLCKNGCCDALACDDGCINTIIPDDATNSVGTYFTGW